MDQTRSTLLMRIREPADAEAWGEFVALYEPLLTSYLRHRGLGPEDQRDVVQEVFARLVKTLPNFKLDRRRGRFRTWLWQVCQSAAGRFGARKRHQARAEDVWLDRLIESPSPKPGDSDPEWRRMHRSRVLAFALDRVRARSRPTTWACFERHLLQRRPSAQVASELGISANAVDINCSRVLDRVRQLCTECLEELANGLDASP